jgi:hypothetical protein
VQWNASSKSCTWLSVGHDASTALMLANTTLDDVNLFVKGLKNEGDTAVAIWNRLEVAIKDKELDRYSAKLHNATTPLLLQQSVNTPVTCLTSSLNALPPSICCKSHPTYHPQFPTHPRPVSPSHISNPLAYQPFPINMPTYLSHAPIHDSCFSAVAQRHYQ